jgi:hypothetical protein
VLRRGMQMRIRSHVVGLAVFGLVAFAGALAVAPGAGAATYNCSGIARAYSNGAYVIVTEYAGARCLWVQARVSISPAGVLYGPQGSAQSVTPTVSPRNYVKGSARAKYNDSCFFLWGDLPLDDYQWVWQLPCSRV